MKVYRLSISIIAIALACFIYSCKDHHDPVDYDGQYQNQGSSGHILAGITATVAHYQVTLMDGYPKAVSGGWEWRWKIVNPSPSSTNKDLSHWDLSLGECATMDNIVSAAYSTNQTNWTSFTPEYQEDPSTRDCNSQIGSTLKFDYGTSGTNPTYYRLIVNQDFMVDNNALMMVKFGRNCVVDEFPGIGCINVPTGECWSDPILTFGGNKKFQLTDYRYIRYDINGLGTQTTYNLVDYTGNIYGTVAISDNGTTTTVTIATSGDWYLTTTYLDVACSESLLDAYGGYPLLNDFQYITPLDPYVQSYSYTFNTVTCNCGVTYMMAYARVVQQIDCE